MSTTPAPNSNTNSTNTSSRPTDKAYILALEKQLLSVYDHIAKAITSLSRMEGSSLPPFLPNVTNNSSNTNNPILAKATTAARNKKPKQQPQQLQHHTESENGATHLNHHSEENHSSDTITSDSLTSVDILDMKFWKTEIDDVLDSAKQKHLHRSRKKSISKPSTKQHLQVVKQTLPPIPSIPPLLTTMAKMDVSEDDDDLPDDDDDDMPSDESDMDQHDESEDEHSHESMPSTSADVLHPVEAIKQQRKPSAKKKRKITADSFIVTTPDDHQTSKRPRKRPPPKNAERKKQNWLNQDGEVSENLAHLLGAQVISRANAYRKVWQYIKANNLQKDSTNKKKIYCDDLLMRALKPADPVIANMYQLNQLIQKQFKEKSANTSPASIKTSNTATTSLAPVPAPSIPLLVPAVNTLIAAAMVTTTPPQAPAVSTPPPLVQPAPLAPSFAQPTIVQPKAPVQATPVKVFRIQPPQPQQSPPSLPSSTPISSPSTPQQHQQPILSNVNEAASLVLQALANGNPQLPPHTTHLLYSHVITPFAQHLKNAMAAKQPSTPGVNPPVVVGARPANAAASRLVQQTPLFAANLNNKTV